MASVVALGGGAATGCLALEPPTGDENRGGQQIDLGEQRFVDLYEAVSASVVELRVSGGPGSTDNGGSGSGFMISDDQLVTNEHVVMDQDGAEIRYRDDDWGAGTVRETDIHSDLAVLDAEEPPEYAEPLSIEPDFPAIGTEVMAIGSPFGFGGSATVGIVSGVNRSLPSPTGFSIPAAIQTDAAVNPGNSGGPLVDLAGNVRGVVFAGAGENIGFAISGPLANEVLPTLREGERYDHSFLGVQLLDVTPSIAEANDLPETSGIYVEGVIDDSPADELLQGSDTYESINGRDIPTGGDVIIAIDGTQIAQLDALAGYLALETQPGDTIEIEIIRDGASETIDLTIASRPELGDQP